MKKVIFHFDHKANYLGRYEGNIFARFMQAFRDWEYNMVSRLVKVFNLANDNILDAGCGFGIYFNLFKKSVIGVDLSPLSLQKAKERDGKCTLCCSNISSLPFLSNNFDTILCMDTLYLNNKKTQKEIFLEFSRVLKKGGLLIIDIKNSLSIMPLARIRSTSYLGIKHHSYSYWTIKKLLSETGFLILHKEKFFSFFSPYLILVCKKQ